MTVLRKTYLLFLNTHTLISFVYSHIFSYLLIHWFSRQFYAIYCLKANPFFLIIISWKHIEFPLTYHFSFFVRNQPPTGYSITSRSPDWWVKIILGGQFSPTIIAMDFRMYIFPRSFLAHWLTRNVILIKLPYPIFMMSIVLSGK